MDIQTVVHKAAETYTRKPALIFKGTTVSFGQLRDEVYQLANALKKLNIKRGDKVAIFLPNCPEYIYSYLAIFCCRAVGVPLDFMLKREELISCLSHSNTKLLIARPNHDVDLMELKKSLPQLEQIVVVGEPVLGLASYRDIVVQSSNQAQFAPILEMDPALIMYTSGTTGKPKGILLNYKHLEGSPKAMEHFVDLSARDVKLCAIPLSHIGGFIYIQNSIIFGITLVLMERFQPLEFLELIQQHQVTCFHIVPAMYMAILTLKHIEKFDLTSLRWVVVFGAPSSPEVMERFHKYCPNAKLLNGWGMTETCPPNTVTPLGSTNIASIGKPAPNCQIKIVDDDGQEVKTGEIGEIIISGWVVMVEYYLDPEATAAMKKNGWLYTGDLGRFDAEGFLYIMGRKKEMIKVGGQIVYAPEVEAALHKHEAVAEAAVIGVADALRGESVKAFVVLKEKNSLSADELRYYCREHLAHFKVPQTVEIRESLPKNRTGKVDKEALKQETAPISSS